MATSTSPKKNSHKPLQKECIRYMTVKHLRECFAGISPCADTFSHIRVSRKDRAQQILAYIMPTLTEAPDGTLEPIGYAAAIASLFPDLDPADLITTIIRPKASTPAASPPPLLAEINHQIPMEQLKTITTALFTYWNANGIKNLSQKDIARELSQSASTYGRKVGWTYPLQDIPTPQNNASVTAQAVSTHEDQAPSTLPDAVIHADTTPTNAVETITPDDAAEDIETNANPKNDHMPATPMEFDLFSATYKD